VKDKKSAHQNGRSIAFTMVELLMVIGIIAILVALLIPALTTVRKMAKEAQQKAQFTTIELALTAFRNDYGEYPPSHGNDYSSDPPTPEYFYCGAQTLAEALVGWDLMGFHPNSAWRADGKDKDNGDTSYTGATIGTPADKEANLKERKGPYLDLKTANVFRLGDLFTTVPSTFEQDTFVICDVFGVKPVNVRGKTVKAGTPILYYRANPSSKTMDISTIPSNDYTQLIYNRLDNYYFIGEVKEPADEARYPSLPTPVNPLYGNAEVFCDYITDPKVTTIKWWPSNPESYLLISAGPDGLYGTGDDMGNFDPNVPG
jgi:type II secretory pathway pseudopilin PulG